MSSQRLLGSGEQVLSVFWGRMVKYGLAAAVVFFYITTILHFSYTPDDTYIYLRYAKNISEGEGFAFNSGVRTLGVTSPLWTFLISVGALVKLDPWVVAKTFDLVFASLSIVQVFILAFVILRDKVFAVIGALLFSFDAWFLRWSGSGMETSLAVLLTILAVSYAYRNEYLVAAFVTGVLTLVRPEAVLLFIVIQADNFLNTTERKPVVRTFLTALGIYAAVLTPWLIFSYLYFGTVISNTVAAKAAFPFSWGNAWETVLHCFQVVAVTQLLPALMLVVGFVEALRSHQWYLRKVEVFPLIWIVGLFLGYAVQGVQIISRYLLPTIPFIILYGLWGIKQIAQSWNLPLRRAYQLTAFVALLAMAQNQIVYQQQMVPHMKNFAAGMNDAMKPIAYWLRSNAASNSTVLSAEDVGLLGYISEKHLYDVEGLITPEVRRSFHGASYDAGMVQKAYEAVLHPDYIVDRSTEKERLKSGSLRPVMTVDFPGLAIRNPDTVYYTLYKLSK
ncbi:MAG: hypothetical protein HY562_07770 [Ignavibacteriales bacterium]|nr:hypothetical protein [Ignavibacteriales bacterium]